MKGAKILSTLIGLMGAVSNNGKTDKTDEIVQEALEKLFQAEEKEEAAMVERIHQEKFRISPNCATCQTPCGNTSDYDMENFTKGEEAVQQAKIKLLNTMINYLQKYPVTDTIYRGIAYLGYDLDVRSYESLMEEMSSGVAKDR